MADEEESPVEPTRNRKKTVGVILMIVGVFGFILCLIWFFCGHRNSDAEIYIGTYIILLFMVVFFLVSMTGGILFWVGDNEDRRQSKLNKAVDSQSK
ncbi:MAG: hypothetical protein WC562_09010 [Dehalococcoidia bacterium]